MVRIDGILLIAKARSLVPGARITDEKQEVYASIFISSCVEAFNSTANAVVNLLNRLIQHGKGRKLFLMLDQHPVHRAAKVKKWVEERQDQIEIFFMPGYSPELNPDEYLNNDLKGQAVRKRPPKEGEQLITMVRGHLRRRQRQPRIVRNFFPAPFVQYAAG